METPAVVGALGLAAVIGLLLVQLPSLWVGRAPTPPCETERIEHSFYTQDDGQVAVSVGDGLPLLNHALQDSLGTRPPAGTQQHGPTTYWIDVALSHLRTRLRQQSHEPFAAGNITYLSVRDGMVEARYDVDDDQSDGVDRVPADDFIALLLEWRDLAAAPPGREDGR